MFKDILTFLGLEYRDALLITLYFVVLGISFFKNQINRMILSNKNKKKSYKKFVVKKVKNQHV